MDANKVDMFLLHNARSFESHHLPAIRETLQELDDSEWVKLMGLNLKNPTMMQIVSLIGGQFGIDRFMLGETGMGIAKLLTCGGAGIWTIVDWFLIMGATREKNLEDFDLALM